MIDIDLIELGPYTAGEIPPPLVYTFKDSTGAAINLTGHVARFTYKRLGGSAVTRTATVAADQTANRGEVTYPWVAADLETAGAYLGEMWVGNGSNRFASVEFRWRVLAPSGTAPAI